MKHTLFSILIFLFSTTQLIAQFAGGTGTEAAPYQIETVEQLQEIANHLDKHFIQIVDIDAGVTQTWNEGKGFLPIGDDLIPFSGSYNGRDHQIVNLHIDNEDNRIGLFGSLEDGVVENINLIDVDITGGSYTGSLVGWNENGIIKNSMTSGTIRGSVGVGGLVGHNFFGGEIISTQSNVVVYGYDNVGGLVGNNWANLFNSYSNGEVHIENQLGSGSAGGLVGNNTVLIHSSFSGSTVDGQEGVGGLSGKNSGSIKQSYSTGLVNGVQDVGGYVGSNGGDIESSYWNSENTGQSVGVGRGYKDGVTGLTTEQMTGKSAEQNMPDLTFGGTWGSIPEDYPKLLWSIPYFSIVNSSSNAPITEGQLFEIDIQVKNIGGVTDSQAVSLIDEGGETLDIFENLSLESEQIKTISLQWQTNEGDEGQYSFSIVSDYDQQAIDFVVSILPATVELIAPEDKQSEVTIVPTFEWAEAERAIRYQIQISSDSEFGTILHERTNLDDLVYDVSDSLKYMTTYYWRVRGSHDSGSGDWSNVRSFTTTNIETPEVVNLEIPIDQATNVSVEPKLIWNDSNRAETYHLQLTSHVNFEELLIDVESINNTDYKVSDELVYGTTYTWRVRAKNESGYSDWSESISFTTSLATSTDSDFIPISYVLKQNYPNPFNPTTQIQYSLPEQTHVAVNIYNTLGQRVASLVDQVKNPGIHEVSFDASGLSSGVYLYRIQTPSHSETRRMMLVK
ncbi:T9SS C-terminal target domain-containing protein [Rhodohalobacter sp. SW132]|uniref:T9SS type A sorting domain-containing protein n=1 Tax=Rhodohalobacter sp. SW132 TaxID=2293433 RepID=UPI000E26320C|nr:T9SS type A sorting domain-containing protein [Rhodohalobacter sp. SW132]REL32980.1 T9SS C-terminal target domain-containing protein [Rhodohalobacter sp. SW132]